MKDNIMDHIKTFEDAAKATGRDSRVPDFSQLPVDLREYFAAQYQIIVITEALNEEWEPDWDDNHQKKWVPWFYPKTDKGFVFFDAYHGHSHATAGNGTRLCFRSEALAKYAGTQFIHIWNKILLK